MSEVSDELKIQIDEYNLVEKPAIDLFKKLNYNYTYGKTLNKEPQQFFLTNTLKTKIKELNPWLTEANLNKIIREITLIQAISEIEANKTFYYKLVNYTSIKQDKGFGKKSQTVKIIDFENIENNDFTVINQFSIKNKEFTIIPDIVIFINGIPIATIECKSPNINYPTDRAIDQLFSYKQKNEQFFYPNQLLITLARYQAKFSTTYSPAKFFFDWNIPYPNIEELKQIIEKPIKQDILLYSIFKKENLLDLIQNYIVFEEEDNKLLKKLARYNQYIASNKILQRIKTEQGGVIWHTQGSGKSLTMTFTAQKIRRIQKIKDTEIQNPCILIVTDRTDLDDQISTTFKNCNFPNPIQIDSIKQLNEELKNPTGKTLFTTIQKFGTEKGKIHPILSESENILVFVDEGHRTNYGELALNMRTAIPNAKFVAFTGTPIDKKDKSTPRVFGKYIDKYLPKQSIEDKATVEIKYQPRLERVHIKSSELDVLFDEEFSDYTEEEREVIKKKYGKYRYIAEADERIKDICKDLLNHYKTSVQPEGFKAQIVTISRDAAVKYKKFLDELGAPRSEVIISKNPTDKPDSELRKHYKTKAEQRALIKEFRKEMTGEDDLCLLIVCDMLLTGFDAPIEQVMYLDKPLREHNLMQAVARVNRTYKENKTHGLIIDYCGVSKKLKEALEIFNDGDVEGYLQPLLADVAKAEQARNKVKAFFERIPKTYDSEKYTDECIEILSQKDTRIRFEQALKEFIIYVGNIMPNPQANQFKKDIHFYGKIYQIMRNTFDITGTSVVDVSEKVKQLINEHLESQGIEVLHEPMDLYSDKFNNLLKRKKSNKAKASIMEHKIRTTINNLMPTNPVYYTSLRQ
ncbi:MAG: HsdR family type I site-specific deoxyribonuclease, partial [Thermoplasmatales archaeon]|nr:HsdR family type I site-specific deoxyribonuclease [Thermoplasmatales archaeon]